MKRTHYSLLLMIAACSFQNSLLFSMQNEFHATCQEITPDNILKRMVYTWNEELAPIAFKDLRYLTISHYDFEENVQEGELVVHKEAAQDLLEIFEKLFRAKFPIKSMKLIDDFEGSDDASMEANNTSALYVRLVANSNRLSNHSWGMSIDINPFLNPFIREKFFCPKKAIRYLDRTLNEPGMITPESYIYQLFKEKGWQWGGECFYERDKTEDLHHFQKIIPGINKNTN